MATYRKFGKLFEPNGHEHKTLQNVLKGELTEPFNCARFGLDESNPADLKDLRWQVEDEFKRWKQVHRNHIAYIAIDMAEVDENAYVLQAFLQPMGQNALAALNEGLVWNNDTMKPDIVASVAMYEKVLERGVVGPQVWGPVTNLARNYAEFRPVRARIVYLRMKGNMTQGVIRPPVDA